MDPLNIRPATVPVLRFDTQRQVLEILSPGGLVLHTLNAFETLTALNLFLSAVIRQASGAPVPPFVEIKRAITNPVEDANPQD